ncbi:MAG: hypothetical protein JRC77_07900, partial [Deltaproteobacteria bacterium]|nr:hypothetical protein [Deltaproteobacteria bacterium]
MPISEQLAWPSCSPKKNQLSTLCLAVLWGFSAAFSLGLNPATVQADEISPGSCDTSRFIGEKSTYAIDIHFLRSMIPATKGAKGVKRRGENYEASSPVILSVQGLQHYEEAGGSYFLGHMAARSLKWFDKLFNYKEDIYAMVDTDLSKTRRSWEHSRLRKSPMKKQDEKEVNFEINWNDPPTVKSYKDQRHRYTFPSIARKKPG